MNVTKLTKHPLLLNEILNWRRMTISLTFGISSHTKMIGALFHSKFSGGNAQRSARHQIHCGKEVLNWLLRFFQIGVSTVFSAWATLLGFRLQKSPILTDKRALNSDTNVQYSDSRSQVFSFFWRHERWCRVSGDCPALWHTRHKVINCIKDLSNTAHTHSIDNENETTTTQTKRGIVKWGICTECTCASASFVQAILCYVYMPYFLLVTCICLVSTFCYVLMPHFCGL